MPKIFLQGLELPARVGVNADELTRQQVLRFDIEIETQELPGATTERIRDTVDYRDLVSSVTAILAERHYPLLETIAKRVADDLARHRLVVAVRVRVKKPGAIAEAETAGVEFTAAKPADPPQCVPIDPKDIAPSSLPHEDVVIVGGGVAGLSAALWCWRLGRRALVIDPSSTLGGQLAMVHSPMPDIPALGALTGEQLKERLLERFAAHEGRWLRGKLASLNYDSATKTWTSAVGIESGTVPLNSSTVVLATGVRRRDLGVAGEEQFRGRGLLPTASKDVHQLQGQRVAVIGGGDSACENALKLADVGARVVIVHRGAQLRARATLLNAVRNHDAIELRLHTSVIAFCGDTQLRRLELSHGAALDASFALVRIGWTPNTEPFSAAWKDAEGFLKCGASQGVGPGLPAWAAGDVRGPSAPCVATAAGDGACAAKSACLWVERRGHSA